MPVACAPVLPHNLMQSHHGKGNKDYLAKKQIVNILAPSTQFCRSILKVRISTALSKKQLKQRDYSVNTRGGTNQSAGPPHPTDRSPQRSACTPRNPIHTVQYPANPTLQTHPAPEDETHRAALLRKLKISPISRSPPPPT